MVFGIVIVIVVIIIIILVFLYFKIRRNPNAGIISHFSEIKDSFQTGDLMLFSCNRRHLPGGWIDAAYQTLSDCMFGHLGLILRHKDKIYVVDCVPSDQTGNLGSYFLNNDYSQGGIRIIKIEYLLHRYTKDYNGVYGIKHISKPINNHRFNKVLKTFTGTTYENKMFFLKLAFVDAFISKERAIKLLGSDPYAHTDRMMCSEFVHRLLHKCGILKKYPSKLFWPFLVLSPEFEDLEIVKYGPCIKFRL